MNRFDSLAEINERELTGFDEIIDVRAPSEFADDHIPGAINLPVLYDRERNEVGTIYTCRSRFDARRIGASYVSKNISDHLNTHFANIPKSYRPLVYCWRGGMRSRALATVLAEVGWQGSVLAGGYRTWRKRVVMHLREELHLFPFVLLDGQTGTNKTVILQLLAQHGCQILDLEAIAKHRGSIFGDVNGESQPPQKLFESLLWQKLCSMDLSKPIIVEAESSIIGRRSLPTNLLRSMRTAKRIELRADDWARANNLVVVYEDLVQNPERLEKTLERLQPFHSKAAFDTWIKFIHQRAYPQLAHTLITDHYDPCYERQRGKRKDVPLEVIELGDISESAINRAVGLIVALAQ